MTRSPLMFASLALLGLGAGVFGRSHNSDDTMDKVQGVRVSSRFPCDGSTNPQDEVGLATTFSPAGLQRAFHIDVFESQYCKRLDLYFFCMTHGHDRWKHEWVRDSMTPDGPNRVWINSCAAWESKDTPEYVLSGWYREGLDKKALWKQAVLKKVSDTPEVYEFADPQGGTGRIEIKRK